VAWYLHKHNNIIYKYILYIYVIVNYLLLYYPIFDSSKYNTYLYICITITCELWLLLEYLLSLLTTYIFIILILFYHGIMRFSQFWQLQILAISDRFHRLYGIFELDSWCNILQEKIKCIILKRLVSSLHFWKRKFEKRIKYRIKWHREQTKSFANSGRSCDGIV